MSRAYERVWYSGVLLNRRSLAAYLQADSYLKDFHNISAPDISQGSYSTSIGASGGTHSGGGAIDIHFIGTRNKIVIQTFREVGWAIWYRPELWINGHREWDDHNHGILVGDREMSYEASKQIHDYYAGLNGLASHLRDSTPRPNPIPKFMYPLGLVNLAKIQTEAKKTRNWDPNTSTKLVQRALNIKRGSDLPIDGIFGPKTRKVFGRFELQVGGDGDGLPGEFATCHLGLARFNVGGR